VAFGLVVFLLAPSPYLRGVGAVLALLKPQLSFLALFFVFLQEERREFWKVLVFPLIVGSLSFIFYGIDWPVRWIENALSLPVHMRRQASIDIWRLGLFFIWVPFLFKDRFQRMQISLVVTAIATPFYSVYSYVIFLLFLCPWWGVVLTYAWIIALPWMGEAAIRFAWVLPVALIAKLLYDSWRSRQTTHIAQQES
jgi:hypothetical protein